MFDFIHEAFHYIVNSSDYFSLSLNSVKEKDKKSESNLNEEQKNEITIIIDKCIRVIYKPGALPID